MDGKQYEIDLSERNAAKLRDLFAPFVGAGRKVGGVSHSPRMASVPRKSREDTKAIREWAAAQGMAISARGRLSSEVIDAYEARDERSTVAEPIESVVVVDAPVKKARGRAKASQPEFSGAE